MATSIFQFNASDTNTDNINILIPSVNPSYFSPSTDYIEYVIKSNTSDLLIIDYNFKNYSFPTNGTVISNAISNIEFDPQSDLSRAGFSLGSYSTYYNFYRNQLGTSVTNQNIFIKEISPDRTELKLNFLSIPITLSDDLELFKINVSNNLSTNVEEFYLNFGNNNLVTANNFDYDSNTLEVIVNLLNPLPNNITTNTQLWVVTKIADSIGFSIEITPDKVTPTFIANDIKGPNFNLAVNDRINNSTDYIDSTQLFSTTLSSSYNQLTSILEEKGIEINIDYSNFSNFIHFSSAVARINNFYYKVGLIEDYTRDLNTINSITGPTSQSYSVSSSKNIIENNINNIITNFDGFEYYMYYTSGSEYSYPKQNSTQPYTLYSPTSSQALAWLGDSNINSANFSGILASASFYDNDNKDYLYYTIPKYLTSDPVNTSYNSFIQMIGQFFDNIWVYYKDVTNLYQADNRLDHGISKDLVSQALQSFGVKIYQNNFSPEDLYSAFLGYLSNPNTTGSLPVTANSGLEYINNYVTASYSASIEPLDDVNKEVYKRLYHNLPYLAKTKGTIPGLRALINCFGVPDTILRISEFGGRDKDTSTYDYFDQQFNYALDNIENSIPVTSSFTINPAWGAGGNRPESIQLRIKPDNYGDFRIAEVQNLFEISGSSGSYYTNLTLWYTGSGLSTSSYSGSTIDPYYQYGTLVLDTIGDLTITCSIYAPFFDGNWWSIQVDRSGSFGAKPNEGDQTFTLLAGSSGYYDGYDGNQIMHLYSSSIENTPTYGYSGSKITFFDTPTNGNYDAVSFLGLCQEIRYWAATQSISSFKDYVMNPQSIDFAGENTYSSELAARLPLGGDLYTGSISVHPKVSGSWVTTSSFIVGGGSNPNGFFINRPKFTSNVEPRFLNSPVIGLRGRVTDKIQIISSSLPTGSVISQYTSIEQSYPSLGSESPDVNLLEVAFSPQNEINDDIIDSLGYFNIGEYIGDPRQVSSSATSYPDLNTLSNNFFQKYFDTYDLFDYVRLIKYFDNSLFKMIKDFVPARTGLVSGVVIKQHILERNKYPQPKVDNSQYQNLNITASDSGRILSSSFNYGENLTYEGTIDTAFIDGGTGGTFDQYNTLIPGVGDTITFNTPPLVYSGSFIINSTSPINYFTVSSSILHFDYRNTPDQIEFVNGEMITYFTGKTIIGTTGLLPAGETVTFILSSSLQGQITSNTVVGFPTSYTIFSPYISCSNEERFSLWIQGDAGTIPTTLSPIYFGVYEFLPYSEQTWPQYYTGSTGVSTIIHSTQDEFYDGELPGTELVVTNGELNDANDFKYPTTFEIYYDPTLYLSSITPLENFLNINTSPNQGEIYLWFDTGSILQPSPNVPQRQ